MGTWRCRDRGSGLTALVLVFAAASSGRAHFVAIGSFHLGSQPAADLVVPHAPIEFSRTGQDTRDDPPYSQHEWFGRNLSFSRPRNTSLPEIPQGRVRNSVVFLIFSAEGGEGNSLAGTATTSVYRVGLGSGGGGTVGPRSWVGGITKSEGTPMWVEVRGRTRREIESATLEPFEESLAPSDLTLALRDTLRILSDGLSVLRGPPGEAAGQVETLRLESEERYGRKVDRFLFLDVPELSTVLQWMGTLLVCVFVWRRARATR